MRFLLLLTAVLLASCSSTDGFTPGPNDNAAGSSASGAPPHVTASGTGGGPSTKGGAASGGSHAGDSSIAGEGGAAQAAGSSSVSEGGEGGSAAGAGGVDQTQAGEGGGGSVGTSGSGNDAGAGGEAGSTTDPGPDPCEDVAPWDPQESWTAYAQNEPRSFAGELWQCQAPQFCHTYPGHPEAAGWFKVSDCAGGPTGEEAPCQCAAGACCDGCYFRPRSYFCGEVVRHTSCYGDTVPACGGATEKVDRDYWNLFCSGDTGGECTRWGAHTKYQGLACPSGSGCVDGSSQASCEPCAN